MSFRPIQSLRRHTRPVSNVLPLVLSLGPAYLAFHYSRAGTGGRVGLTAPFDYDRRSVESGYAYGRDDAVLGLVVFSDFECPYCAVFAQSVMPDIKKAFVDPGRLWLAFQHFPLTEIHANAMPAANLADCAAHQGQFEAIHNRLFQDAGALGPEYFAAFGEMTGVDTNALARCMAVNRSAHVMAQRTAAVGRGVKSTPTLFVGRSTATNLRVEVVLEGLHSFQELSSIFDKVASKRDGARPR